MTEQTATADDAVKAIRAGLKGNPINRSHSCDWHENIEALTSASLNAVFFHVNFVDKHPYIPDAAEIDYAEVLKSSVFVARKARNCSVIVLTDDKTEISIAGVQVVRLPVQSDQMMYSRMRAYRAVSQKLTGNVLFLDTDVHLMRDFGPLFEGEFDVGLTYRPDYPPMPYNEGVIRGKPCPGLNLFWNQALNTYDMLAELPEVKAMYRVPLRMWRGGQLTLGALFNWSRPESGSLDAMNREVRYRLLPCELYNYPVKGSEPRKALNEKWALHYKGAAKAASRK